ncbi:MAG: hypothetical protein AAF563_14725 [Pseudomonadota bacterium]
MISALWTSFATIMGVWLITMISLVANLLATVYATATRSRQLGMRHATDR